ncbi:hypothetical protein GCM10010406_45280 [Streptomyces thermolineatus]|uniref:Uncharacterized protein n=1 Tax=Streptomyces thermolineatus TaxID=44033 RepID=A0ABN3MKF8_9ACTN
MSRTIHHVRRHGFLAGWYEARPHLDRCAPYVLTDLRYSAAELRAAEAEGRRPRPARLTHRRRLTGLAVYLMRCGCVSGYAAVQEGRARRGVRDDLAAIRARYGAGAVTTDGPWWETDLGIDVPPTRHRHSALYSL